MSGVRQYLETLVDSALQNSVWLFGLTSTQLLHGMHFQRTYAPTMIAQFLGNNSKLTYFFSLTARFRLLLYYVGDCAMHLCPLCNRRTRNVLDDDDVDHLRVSDNYTTAFVLQHSTLGYSAVRYVRKTAPVGFKC